MNANAIGDRAAEYVLNGITRLQKLPRHEGAAWYERLNSDTLNQASSEKDVLGQLFGGYWQGLIALGFVTEDERARFEDTTLNYYPRGITEAAHCGFALGDEFMTWDALNAEWKRQIAILRKAARN
ncbi:MAG TPA: hypothetical protein VHD38_03760 [Candidatus Paceibacterota bacterium]|nr:hypothetical protein [Candidatus Paceibacterota bacterium]